MGSPCTQAFRTIDPGLGYGDWALWKYTLNTSLGASAMPYIFVTPPQQVASADLLSYVLHYSMGTDAPKTQPPAVSSRSRRCHS